MISILVSCVAQEAEERVGVLGWQRTVAHTLQSAKVSPELSSMVGDGRVPLDMHCLWVWNTSNMEVWDPGQINNLIVYVLFE